MSELEDRINSVLNDPGQMEQISKLAQSLMGGAGTESVGTDTGLLGKLGSLIPQTGGGDKQALLNAMKPYLSEKRRQKLERAVKLAALAKVARLALSDTEGDHV